MTPRRDEPDRPALVWVGAGALVLALLAAFVVTCSERSSFAVPVPDAPPHPADSYEGTSGMGADGFGGYPAKPIPTPRR